MAVGAGSIKRASKLNAESAESKSTTTKAGTTKSAASKSAATKAGATKSATAKNTAAKKTASKVSAPKTVAETSATPKPQAETTVNVMVPTKEVMQEVVKIASSHKVCRLTEDLPVHLL